VSLDILPGAMWNEQIASGSIPWQAFQSHQSVGFTARQSPRRSGRRPIPRQRRGVRHSLASPRRTARCHRRRACPFTLWKDVVDASAVVRSDCERCLYFLRRHVLFDDYTGVDYGVEEGLRIDENTSRIARSRLVYVPAAIPKNTERAARLSR